MLTESLRSYNYSPQLGRDLKALFLIKSFNQQAMFRSAIERIRSGGPRKDIIGITRVRDCHEGVAFVAGLDVEQLDLSQAEWQYKTREATGASFSQAKLVLASGDMAEIIDNSARNRILYHYPWFGHMHTVSFSSDGQRVLLASSGFDTIFEIDINDGHIVWEWNGWENGYAQSGLGQYLTRTREVSERWSAEGKSVLFVNNPLKYAPFGIPTGLRACHLNGAAYGEENVILSTFFHQGLAVAIDKITGKPAEIAQGMVSVHGFLPDRNYGFIITDTGQGKFIILDRQFKPKRIITFSELPLPDSHLPLGEWLQYVTNIHGTLYAAVDIRRKSLFLFDTEKRTYRQIGIQPDWALQMVLSAPEGFPFTDPSGFQTIKKEISKIPLVFQKPQYEQRH